MEAFLDGLTKEGFSDDGTVEDDGLSAYPALRRMRPALSEDHAAVGFEESLENLLDRMALIRSESD